MSEGCADALGDGRRGSSGLHGQISKTLDFYICGHCLHAAVESQGEGKAEGSWHSVFRKLGLSTSGSLSERGCSGSNQGEG